MNTVLTRIRTRILQIIMAKTNDELVHDLANVAADILDQEYQNKTSVPELDDITVDFVARKVIVHHAIEAEKDLFRNYLSVRFWIAYLTDSKTAQNELKAVKEFVAIGRKMNKEAA